jgi:putative NADPH-quinone reductase
MFREEYFTMPNFLLIVSHPDVKSQSTSHQLADTAKAVLIAAGNEVRVVDLILAGFNVGASPADFVAVPPDQRLLYQKLQTPANLSPRIKEQQANLEWASHVIVFGPIYFYRYPASLYAYAERVLTVGWGYNFTIPREKLILYNKAILFVITTGEASEFYSHGGPLTSLDGLLYSTTYAFNACGFRVYRSQGIWQAGRTPEPFEEIAAKFSKAVLNLEKRPFLPFRDPGKKAGVDELQVFAELPNITLAEAAAF